MRAIMGFCGTKSDAMSVAEGVLQNDCFVDVLNIIPHATMALIGIFIITVWNHSVMGKLKVKTWVHFQGHNVRWIFTLTLLFSVIFEIAEGVISDSNDPDDTNYHTFIPQCLALLGALISIVYYHKVEMWNSPKFLLPLLAYWPASFSLKFLKVFSMLKNNITWIHLKMWLAWIDIIIYILLFLVDLNLLRVQRYAFFKRSRRLKPPDDLERTRFINSYANFLSKAIYWWMNDIMVIGYKRPLSLKDLGDLPKSEQAVKHYKKLQMIFDQEKEKALMNDRNPSLSKSYLKATWQMLLLSALFRFLGDMLAFVGPIFIENIVSYANNVIHNESFANATVKRDPIITTDRFFWNGYTLSVVLFLASVLQNTFLHSHHFIVIREGVRLRSAIQAMVYSKMLRLSSLTLNNGQLTSGQIMNHMSVDATFLMYFFFFVHYLWAVPIQVAITLGILYYKLGLSAIIGGLFVVLCAPVMYFLGVWMSTMQKNILAQSDRRVKKMNEVIQGIHVIKLLAWEDAFSHNVETTRQKEIRYLIPHACVKGLMGVIGMTAPVIGAMLTFILYPLMSSEALTAGRTMSILALFNLLSGPLQLLTLVSASVANARVSSRRLTPFLLAPEVSCASPRQCSSSVMADPASEHSEKYDAVINVDADNGQMEMIPLRFDQPDNVSCRSGSIMSFGSGGATHKSHSRQNSADSMLDVHESRASSISRNLTSAELLEVKPLPLIRKSSAPVFGANDGQPEYKRRRHHSGVSSCDIDDIAEELVFMEARIAVELSGGNFSWDLKSREVFLKDINVKIPTGKLTMIVGQVGAGKSSLLAAMLGEMITVSGTVEWSSDVRVAYVSQIPWLLNASLRNNILFGTPYVWGKYRKVLSACALQPDLEQLPSADLTEIGEKGINLSGGQKQRVAIARALYSGADTVIMDDPLSALDVHVGRQVFDEAIMKRLIKKKKTVILVSHQVQYLSYANQVIVVADGKIYFQGKVSEVKKFDPDLYDSWRKTIKEVRASEHKFESEHLLLERKLSGGSSIGHDTLGRPASVQSQLSVPGIIGGRKMSQLSQMSVMTEASNEEQGENEENDKDVVDSLDEKGHMIKQEHKETGAVSLSVYLRYFKACSVPLCIISFLLQIVYHAVLVCANFWLTTWSSQSAAAAYHRHHHVQPYFYGNLSQSAMFGNITTSSSFQEQSFTDKFYMNVFAALSSASVLAAFLATLIVLISGTFGGKVLFVKMLHNVMHLPVRFFDTNPSGRILNRFSADITAIDQRLASNLENLLRCIFYSLSAVFVNCVTTPFFLLAVVPLAIIYYLLQRFFRFSSRELQRLDSVTKSPIFSHFSETLSGLQTIRAYRAEGEFRRRIMQAIDDNATPFLFLQAANRWLGIRLEYLSSLLVFASAVASLSSGIKGHMDPAFIGLCIAYALLISGQLNWIVRISADVEMTMNSVERVLEYTDLPPEKYPGKKEKEVIRDGSPWPSEGCIQFQDVSLAYAEDLDTILTNVSFTIEPGEKIGICGRTGSGKSSLVLAMFRMLEIVRGEIIIDDVNIKSLPLHYLRSVLAVIPQDPLLFSGTIRYNLDPEGRRSDEQLWAALEAVQMKDVIATSSALLDFDVTEGGGNFSVGQRQLLCMARAIVRDSCIVILDEATASIDLETESKIQGIIYGPDFKGRTVLTIAHRISTIKQCDRVMVLDSGFMHEFASPADLLTDTNSLFYSLANSGDASAMLPKKLSASSLHAD